jgi:phospholipid/cholesterol/gamma-HCH transport system permease protein
MSRGVFFENIYLFTSMGDILAGTIKAGIYGFIIGLFSTYYGYFVTGGASGVGSAVNSSVVNSILFFIFLNYILSSIFFGAF